VLEKENRMKSLNSNLELSFATATAIVLLLAGVLTASGCGKSEEESHEPAYLLVQSSRAFSYDGERLTVHGTSPTTIFFSDRPDRIAGHLSLEEAYAWGQSGDNSFAENPPNAVLSLLAGGEMANVVVTLRDSFVDGDAISWEVDILEGDLPARGGPNTLFIDVLGNPLTPLSIAGMRRRTRRRSLAVGYAVGAATVAATSHDDTSDSAAAASDAARSADQAADAANEASASAQDAADAARSTGAPSIEQQLAQLKDLLDKELITQEDYDAKKKQILEGM
jgi:hypothetical protein